MNFLIILGAWVVVFPIELFAFLTITLLRVIVVLAIMPAKIWKDLEEKLIDIHNRR